MIQSRYYLQLDEHGDIVAPQDKSIYIQQHTLVQIQLQNKKQAQIPLLLERIHYKSVQDKINHHTDVKKLGQTHKLTQFHLSENGDWILNIKFEQNGSAYFRVLWVDDRNHICYVGNPNYLIVQPLIANRLKGLTIQTLLPYCMGNFSEYHTQLESQVKLGYGAFHFPPLQQLGQSPSLYAIADQQKLNKDIFGDKSLEDLTNLFKQFPNQLFFIDILLNHTAFDSQWLVNEEFENATYHIGNSPHLEAAIRLDQAISDFTNMLSKGKVKSYPKTSIDNEGDLKQLMQVLEHDIIRKMNFHEYFLFDIDNVINKIGKQCQLVESKSQEQEEGDNIFVTSPSETLFKLIEKHTIGKGSGRFGVHLGHEVEDFLGKNSKKISKEFLREVLSYFNGKFFEEAEQYLREAISCTEGQIRWWKLTLRNHKIEESEKGDSLVPRYFTKLSNGKYVANNGWIQGFDPLKNFAEGHEHHYFRRTIVIWGDLVKLRYGECKADSPALWKYMKQYVQSMAKVFQGLRLDNSHSTPLVVGEYMMRKARKVNQNLLIFAELFTGSNEKDSIFTRQLGLNCLLRETNRCYDSGQLNRELYYYSGDGLNVIGSLPVLVEECDRSHHFYSLLSPQYAPALVYEQSHDNETFIQTHSHKHQLPMAGLISFNNAMGGTVRGYDIYVQNRLSVVDERRLYKINQPQHSIKNIQEQNIVFRFDWKESGNVEIIGSWDQWKEGHVMKSDGKIYYITLPLKVGVYEYKFRVNGEWVTENDKYVNQGGNHEIKVEEYVQEKHNSMENVRCIFNQLKHELNEHYPYIYNQYHGQSLQSITRMNADYSKSKILIANPQFGKCDQLSIIELTGVIDKIDLIVYSTDQIEFQNDNQFIQPSKVEIIKQNSISEFADIYFNSTTKSHYLKFVHIPESFTCVITCKIHQDHSNSINHLNQLLQQNQANLFKQLTPKDLNYLLFMSEPEEQDLNQTGLYFIPNYRQLIYAGFAGPRSPLREAQRYNNLGHPICENVRSGNWLLDYLNNRVQQRLRHHEDLANLVNDMMQTLKSLPRYLIPAYFSQLVNYIYESCKARLPQATKLRKSLLLAGYQFVADLPSSKMMSAGLPHFTTGWARCWGRDTFIAFRGIYLENQLFQDAKQTILTFASCLRHGLIPNLLDSCRNPRYNCRDACWWFIKAIRDYIEYTKEYNFFEEKVNMVFLSDDIEQHYKMKEQNLHNTMSIADIIQNIFQSHAQGIKYREWRAGGQIDSCMQTEGFNIQLQMDEETGFIVGGNWLNCLTWMDKMGSSDNAGNKGVPATSRDGAPIELTALLKLCLDFVAHQNQLKNYPYEGVTINHKKLAFKDWSHFIVLNFEKYYWVPTHIEQNDYHVVEKHIRHRQIYKDLCKSSKPRNEYQLRCNASIAMALAPELFKKEKAKYHLAAVEAYLLKKNSLGLKTLDPQATEYVHYYDNNDQSNHFNVAQGFSYHNGPEWVWVYGYFLKALSIIHGKNDLNPQLFYTYLANHKKVLLENEWYSLPEMTNGDGEYNIYSCRAQAWSISCILEAIVDYEQLQQQQQQQ